MEVEILQGKTLSFISNYIPLIDTIQGLGTSKDEDARDYFNAMGKHMIPFSTVKEGERDLIELAFGKKKADDRKEWLRKLEVCS